MQPARLTPLLAVKATFELLRDTCNEWWGDNALRLGAALAYYAVFSLAPLLIVAIAIASLVFEHQQAHTQVVAEIGRLIGRDGAEAISGMIQNAITPASDFVAGGLSVGVILLGAAGAFAELQQGLNDIWKVPPRPDRGVLGIVRERGASFVMVLVVGILLLLSLILNAAIAALDRWFADHVTFNDLLKPTHFFISFGMGTLLFAMIFKSVPDVRIAWRDVWISAAVTSLLFLVGQWVIALYLAHSAVASAFGAAGSLVIILIWVYYSSQILFFGAELTKVYARTYGSLALSLGVPSGTTAVPLPEPAGGVRADTTRVEPRA
jgi:membrane protein